MNARSRDGPPHRWHFYDNALVNFTRRLNVRRIPGSKVRERKGEKQNPGQEKERSQYLDYHDVS